MKFYRDKKWLEQKYLKEKLSMNKIGKLCGVTSVTICNWLKKHDIPSFSNGVPNYCNLSKEAIEWINGELLGDGCLHSYSPRSARFTYGSKYLEYCQYVKDTLESFGIKGTEVRKFYNKSGWGKYYNSYKYCSHTYVEFLSIYLKWYPEGKKIVPKDITLTSVTLRQWYIGDGTLNRNKVAFGTCGFTISDVNWLVNQLINLGFRATRQFSRNYIYISIKSTKDLFNYIGKCPVVCYQYKWAY